MMRTTTDTRKQGISLASFFRATDILVQQESLSRNALIQKLLAHIGERHELLDSVAYYNAVIERENASNTIVANGIAIPHARLDGVTTPLVGVATSETGITFKEGDAPIHLVLLILIPRNQPGLYLQILRAIAGIMRDKNAAKTVSSFKTAEEVMKFFERGGMMLPDYVCAADVMRSEFTTLKSNDNLKKAIDTFIEKKLDEIPITDSDGDLVGVVSVSAMLKVCLPEYLLWMSDLSPIVNFEPFANVLRNEQNTWLKDIQSTTYATVQMDSPAITVASEFTRKKTSKCYVLDGKKLMGVIDFPIFLNKVFRE
jgi:mannitol/fructose-specific phosphotransferase system IIA component (Ntr-type)